MDFNSYKQYIKDYGKTLDLKLAHGFCDRAGINLTNLLHKDLLFSLIDIYGIDQGYKEYMYLVKLKN